MPECPECNTHVSDAFARVFGNNRNDIFRCPDCDPTEHADERSIAGLPPVERYMEL